MKLHPKAENFLRALERALKGSKQSETALEEIKCHLIDSIAELREGGLEEEAAVVQALERIGSAKLLGRALKAAHRPWFLRWTILLPSGVALSAVITVFGLCFAADYILERSRAEIAKEDKILVQFLKDQETLAKYPFLFTTGNKADAGEFLNTRVAWVGHFSEKFWHPSIVMTEAEQKLIGSKDWLQRKEPEALKKIDLSWMVKLKKYDHWDAFASDGPGLENIHTGVNWVATAAPDFISLMYLAKLRYIRGLKSGQALETLKEVRHLIFLLNSQELLISSMITSTMLASEKRFYDEAVKRKLIRPGDWTPMSDDDRMVFRRAAYGVGEWFDLSTPSNMFAAVAERHESVVGICGGLHEVIQNSKYYGLENRIWPESDLSPNFLRLSNLEEKSRNHCRLTYVKLTRGQAAGNFEDELYSRLAMKVPFLRRYQGARLKSMSQARWTHLYDEALRTPASGSK